MIREIGHAEKRYLSMAAGMLLLFIALMYITFPTKIKVSVDYQDEKNKSAYLVSQENISELESMQFFESQFTAVMRADELSETDSVMIRYDDMLIGEHMPDAWVKVALGNYVFGQMHIGTEAVLGYHDIAFDENGSSYIDGEIPYILVYNIGQMLNAQLSGIIIKHIALWLFLGVCTAVCMLVCRIQINRTLKKISWKFFGGILKELLIISIVTAAGCIVGHMIVLLNEKLILFQELQNAEIYCLIPVWGIIVYVIYKRCGKLSYTCCAAAAIGICLFFSISGQITFLTADERGAIREQAKILEDPLRHWYMVNAWSNYAVIGTFWRIFDWQKMEEFFKLDYTQIGKLLHWIVGNFCLLVICDLVQRRILNKDKQLSGAQMAANYAVLYMVTLLNPAITMAFKSYNYDLFSMLFGALGAVYAFLAVRDKSLRMAAKGIVFAFLGGVEKMTAIPILLIAYAVFTFVVLWRLKGKKNRFLKGYLTAIGTLGIQIFLTELTYRYVCEVLKKGMSPITTLRQIIDIALSRFSPLHSLVYGIIYRKLSGFIAGRVCFILFLGVLIFAAAVFLEWMHEYGVQKKNQIIIRKIENVLRISIAVFMLLGICAMFAGTGYSESKIIYMFYILKNYVISIPTVLLILAVFSIIMTWNQKGYFSILISMFFVTWGVVPFYIMQRRWNPTWTRYLNLFLLLFALLVVSISISDIYRYFSKRNVFGTGLAVCLLFHVCEIAGSMPGFTYFAPFWYGITSYVNQEKEMPVYWGENKASLGRLILEYCQKNGIDIESQPIGIRYGYVRGTWQTAPDNVTVYERDWNSDIDLCGTTEYDFYAFDTQGVQRKMVNGGWPEEAEPIITVKYRGYVIAKIYQGSQLEKYFAEQWKPMTEEADL